MVLATTGCGEQDDSVQMVVCHTHCWTGVLRYPHLTACVPVVRPATVRCAEEAGGLRCHVVTDLILGRYVRAYDYVYAFYTDRSAKRFALQL